LLAGTALELAVAHGDAGTVQAQVHRRCGWRLGLEPLTFIGGDLAAERFCGALDLLGVDPHPGELPHQLAALHEADHRAHQPDHAREGRRQRGVLQAERAVAWAQARFAGVAVVVGALETQRSEHTQERLLVPSGVASQLSAVTSQGGTRMVRRVGVETALDRTGGQLKHLTTGRGLDGLEVHSVDRTRAYERLDFGRDLRREGFFEAPFFGTSSKLASPASSFASHKCSLVSTSSRTKARKRRCSAICSRVWATAAAG